MLNVSLRQLRVFSAVARLRNFSRAGQQIGLTQPAVSRSIAELEAQLGLRLLDRTTRDVELTDAGRSLAARIDRQIEELEATLLDVQGQSVVLHGSVRIASSPTLSAALMPACVAECLRREPTVRVEVYDQVQMLALNSVRQGESDFGVVIDPEDPAELYCETILNDPFRIVFPADHAFRRRRQLGWADLADQPLILLDYASGSRRLIDQALTAHAPRWNVVQTLSHPTTILRMIQAGIGIGVLPALAMPEADLGGLLNRPLMPRVERQIMMVRRRQRSLSPAAQRIWTLVDEVARRPGRAASRQDRQPVG